MWPPEIPELTQTPIAIPDMHNEYKKLIHVKQSITYGPSKRGG